MKNLLPDTYIGVIEGYAFFAINIFSLFYKACCFDKKRRWKIENFLDLLQIAVVLLMSASSC